MKTNQVMTRENAFIQRTKDDYFNATNLIDNWNCNNKHKKILGNFQKLSSTKDFIIQLKNEGIDEPIISARGRGKNSGTWMHPKLFIDLAMWVSVEFKSKAIDYVLDGLIKSRHDAGDYYNQMCATILDKYVEFFGNKPPSMIYMNEARLVKSFVTDKPRNEMTEQQLKQLTYLQKVNANLISKNFGKTKRINLLKQASEITI